MCLLTQMHQAASLSPLSDEDRMNVWKNFDLWRRRLAAAAIAGGANGVITRFAAARSTGY
jgi:hypothetical protein